MFENFSAMEILSRSHWKNLNTVAAGGDPAVQWELGYFYESGVKDKSGKVLAESNLATAMQWYQASASQGYGAAQNALSILLSSGGPVVQDYPQAIRWAKKAVARGDSSAAFNLGTIYRDLRKPALAYRWYERAAAMGNTDAFLQVGLCCLLGLGTRRDVDYAQWAFEQIINGDPANSCQRSKENACYWLGVLRLMRGPGTHSVTAQARALLETANADDDHEQANELLNLIGKSRYLVGA